MKGSLRACRFGGAALAAVLVASPARAHHGRDFLLSQTAEMPHPGQIFLLPRQDYVDGEESELELEPALVFGATERLAVEVHAHVGKLEGEELEYESTSPAIHLLLSPPDLEWGLALSGEYEIAASGDSDGEAGAVPVGEDANRSDSEEEHADRLEARLALSGRRGANLLAVNLVAGKTRVDGADVEWGYSAGWRHDLRERLALGLEAQGDFASHGAHEALVGLYWEASEVWTVNLGVGVGYGDDAIDSSVRTAVVIRLR